MSSSNWPTALLEPTLRALFTATIRENFGYEPDAPDEEVLSDEEWRLSWQAYQQRGSTHSIGVEADRLEALEPFIRQRIEAEAERRLAAELERRTQLWAVLVTANGGDYLAILDQQQLMGDRPDVVPFLRRAAEQLQEASGLPTRLSRFAELEPLAAFMTAPAN